MNDNLGPLVYTVKDIETLLNCEYRKALSIMKQPGFPSFKIGGLLRVKQDDFHRWLDKQKTNRTYR